MTRRTLRRFTDDQVIEMRNRHRGGERIKDIAGGVPCAPGIICQIVLGKTYKDVAGPIRDPAPRAPRGA